MDWKLIQEKIVRLASARQKNIYGLDVFH